VPVVPPPAVASTSTASPGTLLPRLAQYTRSSCPAYRCKRCKLDKRSVAKITECNKILQERVQPHVSGSATLFELMPVV
jgi:hypothetical protein